MDSKITGAMGERIAAKFYVDRGYLLLEHNYKTRMGELDLIFRKEKYIIICEVKTRTTSSFASAKTAVDFYKQRRIVSATKRYLQLTHQSDANIRFDVAEVTPLGDGKWKVNRIKSAFEAQ